MSRLLGYLRSLKRPPAPGRVAATADAVEGYEGAERVWSIPWTEIRRVGYVREESGLENDEDRFLALHASEMLTLISLAAEGAASLARRIPLKFPCVFGDKGDLGHVTADDSVIVWPPEEAGKDLFATIGAVPLRFLVRTEWGFKAQGPKKVEGTGLIDPKDKL